MIVKHSEEFSKYFLEIEKKLSIPQTKHVLDMVSSLITTESKKTVSGLSRTILRNVDRSNRARFLTKSPWDEETLNKSRVSHSLKAILEEARKSKSAPIFLSVDDTLITKSCKRDKIEGISKQYSHVTGKYEWCHTLVSMQAKCSNLSLPLNFKIYKTEEFSSEKGTDFLSKNDLVIELLNEIPFKETNPMYLLMDSWYSSSKLIMEALSKGIYAITPLKSNRIIYPDGVGINIKTFAESIDKQELNLVTVKGTDYYTLRYEGHLNDIPNAVVLISYKVKNGNLLEPMYILTTDIEISAEQIIEYYLNRWEIEVSFRYQKESLGLDHPQMRTLKGLKRFWILVYIAHNFLVFELHKLQKTNIGEIIREQKSKSLTNMILFICELKDSNIKSDEIVKYFVKTAV